MNKPLFLFIGQSASGKTSVADMLAYDGYEQISSYTTRKPRYEGETSHTFISDAEFDKLTDIMAFTNYNGYRYCTTLNQINNADLYVIDPEGVATLLSNYDKLNRVVYIVYFMSNTYNRIMRMLERHDSDTQIVGRLLQDERSNWLDDIYEIKERYHDKLSIRVHVVDANQKLVDVYQDVKTFIEKVTNN